ncbi:hypothetical protein [Mesorhizobium amorphae]|uniref:hypothetical protein n=1 Tax=Mesorhizobium amorphae TaxID=71433 RepID=UPI0021B1B427|nr:hypothetical protein [Mesorhizobium amorphae]
MQAVLRHEIGHFAEPENGNGHTCKRKDHQDTVDDAIAVSGGENADSEPADHPEQRRAENERQGHRGSFDDRGDDLQSAIDE